MSDTKHDYPDYAPGSSPQFRIITEHERTNEIIYGDWWPIDFIPQQGSKVVIEDFKGTRVDGICQITYEYIKTGYNDNAYQLYAIVYVKNGWARYSHG